MRMKHDVRTLPRGPANGFGIAPTLVADDHAELELTNLEHLAVGARRIELTLRRVELHLVLEAGPRSVSIDDERRNAWRVVHDAFGAEHHGDMRAGRGLGDSIPCTL